MEKEILSKVNPINFRDYKPKIKDKDFKIRVKADNEYSNQLLLDCIKYNLFKDIAIEEALKKEDSLKLNYFFLQYQKMFQDEENLILDVNNGNMFVFFKDIEKLKRERRIEKSVFINLFDELERAFDLKLEENIFDFWYEKLNHFTKEQLETKINKIIINESYKPKIATFYKY